ncbi:unnamed protein product [Amoebophrya sp. A25]|nr:unnamed protein product [Amoebophrya sp. A25]|eukprot:GSA25T00024621001.1
MPADVHSSPAGKQHVSAPEVDVTPKNLLSDLKNFVADKGTIMSAISEHVPFPTASSLESTIGTVRNGDLIRNALKKLDADGDGNLSLEELENAGKDAFKKLEEKWLPVRAFLVKHRDSAELGVGYLAAFYGGNFKFLFMASNLAQGTEGGDALSSFHELLQVTAEAKERFKKKLGKGHVLIKTGTVSELSSAAPAQGGEAAGEQPATSAPSIPTSTVMAFLSTVDPAKLVECMTSVYKAFLIALCAALNNNAAKFGLGLALGERISTFLLAVADKMLLKVEESPDLHAGVTALLSQGQQQAAQPTEGENQEALPPKATPSTMTLVVDRSQLSDAEREQLLLQKFPAWQWLKLGLRSLCSTLGLFLSWRLKDAAATFSVCHWGGSRIAGAIFKMMNHSDRALQEMVALGIGWYGFAFHLRHLNRPSLPLLVSVPMLPLTLIERILEGLTLHKELS